MSIKVHSFDVFDTCLTRRCAVPTSVFYDLGREVFLRLGIIPTRANLEHFVSARILAERAVRSKCSKEDITLDEIWKILNHSMGWIDDDTLSFCELNAEERALTPISAARRRIEAARAQGGRVIFISDMYLPVDFIERLLLRYGMAQPGDRVYVSGAIGKNKASGNLFKHVLETEQLAPSEIRHLGDNGTSDYRVPRRLGIGAELFLDARLSPAERNILPAATDPLAADGIAGAMRASRLGDGSTAAAESNELASQFVAPFVMGFATWVLQRSKQLGIRRLYFMSRDCQLTWKVARELASEFGDIDCRYLYASRQALTLPISSSISPEGMPWLLRDAPIIENLLAKLELKLEDLGPLIRNRFEGRETPWRLKSSKDWSVFWQALNAEPVKGRLERLIQERREAARRYFESEGLLDDEPWAIVDLGWTLSCQEALAKLVKDFGGKYSIQGFYLGLRENRVAPGLAGRSEALAYEQRSDFPGLTQDQIIFRQNTLLEHIVGCADHPSVHHYERGEGGKAVPAFSPATDRTAIALWEKVHPAVLDFVVNNRQLVDSFKDSGICREALAKLATGFFDSPTATASQALTGLRIATDQNGLDARPIFQPVTAAFVALWFAPRCRPVVEALDRRRGFWWEGSIAHSGWLMRRMAGLIELFRSAFDLARKFRRQRLYGVS